LVDEPSEQVREPMNANNCSPRTKINVFLDAIQGHTITHTKNPDQTILPSIHAMLEAKQHRP
jgi:hypothetical protein